MNKLDLGESSDENEPLTLSIKGPLGHRKKRISPSRTSGGSAGVRFESVTSDDVERSLLSPDTAHGSLEMKKAALRTDSLGLPIPLSPIRHESLGLPSPSHRSDSLGMGAGMSNPRRSISQSISQGVKNVFNPSQSLSRRGTLTEFVKKNTVSSDFGINPADFGQSSASDYVGQSNAGSTIGGAGRRLSMWGEQLHDKLFAKKDVKEVMRKKLKLNLKDEGNNTPQIYQTDIKNIVDLDNEDKQNVVKAHFAAEFIESTTFRLFILMTIVINSIFIALQTDKDMERKLGYIFSAADQIILTIFVCEILLKWYGGFFTYWKVGWNVFDFIIVAASLIGPSFTFVSNSRVLRILRVLRAFRSLRSISALRPLQLVVQTIIQSLPDMANILLLLVIFMFVAAVIGVSFFSIDSPAYFGSLEKAMFSLFVCITLDGWVEIFNSLRGTQFVLASIYFTLFILVGAFILINLVVAVVVTNLESAIAEQDELDLQQIQEEKGNQGQDDTEELRTYDLTDVIHKKFWKHQKPIEVPNLPALNPHKIQNYMILVTALEDNYSEMLFLREELAKIAKEVWEWNSPVDDDESPAPKARKHSSADEPQQPSGRSKKSTLANLLTRASVMTTASEGVSNSPKSSIKRKSTITSSGYIPLKQLKVVHEEDHPDSETLGKKLHLGVQGTPDSPQEDDVQIAVETKSRDTLISGGTDTSEGPQVADLYTEMTSFAMTKAERREHINERRASLAQELERRDRRGDVLSDMIKMNKKTGNFSGKSQNVNQFVHGLDWIKGTVKGTEDVHERKKRWQLETETDRAGIGTQLIGGPRRASVTSTNLVESQLSYLKMSRDSTLSIEDDEDMIKLVSAKRRASLVNIKQDIEQGKSEAVFLPGQSDSRGSFQESSTGSGPSVTCDSDVIKHSPADMTNMSHGLTIKVTQQPSSGDVLMESISSTSAEDTGTGLVITVTQNQNTSEEMPPVSGE